MSITTHEFTTHNIVVNQMASGEYSMSKIDMMGDDDKSVEFFGKTEFNVQEVQEYLECHQIAEEIRISMRGH